MELIKEELLHYLWKVKKIGATEPFSSSGERIHILNWDRYNVDAGPDFLNACIKLGKTIWAGHIEIHLKSSDWFAHKHDKDPNYDNVILYVVYIHNRPVYRNDGTEIPTLELKGLIGNQVIKRYNSLSRSMLSVPCKNMAGQIPELLWESWRASLMASRLEEKCNQVYELVDTLKGNWEQAFYASFARSLG